MRKIVKFICLLTVLAAVLPSCVSDAETDRPTVVASNFALYDLARAVAGDGCEVEMLIAPGRESHDFEATLADVAKISEAELFVYVGGESEEWAEDVLASIEALGGRVQALRAIDTVETISVTDLHGHSEADEHIWTSIPNAISVMDEICTSLCGLFPDNAEVFIANTAEYKAELTLIDREIGAFVSSAENKTIVVADRFPLRYFAERYGLDFFAAFDGCTSDTEPTLEMISRLAEQVSSLGCPVFVMEMSDGTAARAVQSETGCDILTLHSAHNVTKEDFAAGVTYADIMRQNLAALKTALENIGEQHE